MFNELNPALQKLFPLDDHITSRTNHVLSNRNIKQTMTIYVLSRELRDTWTNLVQKIMTVRRKRTENEQKTTRKLSENT